MSDLSDEEVESVAQAIEDPTTKDNDTFHRPELQFEELSTATDLSTEDLRRLAQLPIQVEIQFGKTKLPVEEVLKLRPGSLVELDKLAGDPLDIVANEQVIAKAEAVVIEENYGIKILEIVGTREKLNLVKSNENE